MFGLTFEKLIIVGVVAAFVIGPERLPHYASVLAKFVRQIRDFTNGAKTRMKEEMGPDFDEVEWKKLDPRQYDPRRIIRDALLEDPAAPVSPAVKPSSPMAEAAPGSGGSAGTGSAGTGSAGNGSAGNGSGTSATAMAAAAGSAAMGLNAVNLGKDLPGDMGGEQFEADPLAADPGFDDGPGVSLSVPVGPTPDYLSGRKTLDREAAEAKSLATAPFDSEAT